MTGFVTYRKHERKKIGRRRSAATSAFETSRNDRCVPSAGCSGYAGTTVPAPIGWLAKAVSLFARLRALIAAVGRTPLLPPSFRSAGLAVVALSPIAMVAHPREPATAGGTTKTRSERRFQWGSLHRLDSAPHVITIHRIADDRTDNCACGADDVVGFLSARVREKRFSDDRRTSMLTLSKSFCILWFSLALAV